MDAAIVDDLKQFITSTVTSTVFQQGATMLEDLKQFITSTVSQQTTELRTDIRKDLATLEAKLDTSIAKVETKIDDLTTFVCDAIDNNDELYELRHKDHERRITKLETKTT